MENSARCQWRRAVEPAAIHPRPDREPTSDYDRKQQLEQNLSHSWAAKLSQIYPTLNALEVDGLLTSREVASEKRPPRKLYQRTGKGTKSLADWFAEGPSLQKERRHYLARVFFLDAARDAGTAVEFFELLYVSMQDRFDRLRAAEQQWRERGPRCPVLLPDNEIYR